MGRSTGLLVNKKPCLGWNNFKLGMCAADHKIIPGSFACRTTPHSMSRWQNKPTWPGKPSKMTRKKNSFSRQAALTSPRPMQKSPSPITPPAWLPQASLTKRWMRRRPCIAGLNSACLMEPSLSTRRKAGSPRQRKAMQPISAWHRHMGRSCETT